jgi:hypothetical protein
LGVYLRQALEGRTNFVLVQYFGKSCSVPNDEEIGGFLKGFIGEPQLAVTFGNAGGKSGSH